MRFLRAAVAAALFLSVLTPAVWANDVTLTSRDGSISLDGTLLGYDGEYYRIETEFGVLTVDGSGVNCEGPGCPDLSSYVAEITISGARSAGSVLMPALIEAFALRQGYAFAREETGSAEIRYTLFEGATGAPAARFYITLTSSGEGIADLLSEVADMALSLRETTPGERNLLQEAGLGDMRLARHARVLALDALVPIVAPGNPVQRLSVGDLGRVFSGEITNWSELGGEDAPITLHLRAEDDGFVELRGRRILSGGRAAAAAARRHPSYDALSRAVARDPFGIGLGSFSHQAGVVPVTLTGGCGFETRADRAAIKSEDYPLTAPVFLYLPARRLPRVGRELLSYMHSAGAQRVIRRAGFVDQALEETGVEAQGRRLANAILSAGEEVGLDELKSVAKLFMERKRLSLSFRFEDGSSVPDAQSRSNVAVLAAALEAGRFDGRALTFVGFSDGQGGAAGNRRLAAKRAATVLRAVREASEGIDDARLRLEATGIGEVLPMACDDSPWGRRVNRRVEVWVK